MKPEELQQMNSRLNNSEYEQKNICLESYPQAVFIQIDAPCNHDCLFCSRPDTYSHFDLDEFRRNFERLLEPLFLRVNRINLTGSGELLLLPEAKKNLSYFNRYRHAEKMFATNGSSLTPKMIDYIIESGNNYVIHISLHSFDGALHKTMTAADTFPVVQHNLNYLRERKRECDNLKVNFVFVATTENIHVLEDFIKHAAMDGADAVIVNYNYIYRLNQKHLSCYFKQKETNKVLREAEKLKEEYRGRMRIELPPFFSKKYSPDSNLCNEAWSQVMINARGDVISCDVAGDSYENIKEKESFMDVWNGNYYTGLRERLVNKKFDCASFCWRANPETVNHFKSHLITRGKNEDELKEFFKGA